MNGDFTIVRRRTAALTATVAVSLWTFLVPIPVSGADPYGDDDGGSSYSDDGGGYGGGDEGAESGGEVPSDGAGFGGGEEGAEHGGGEEGADSGGGDEGSGFGGAEEGAQHGGGEEGTVHGGGDEGTPHGGGDEGLGPGAAEPSDGAGFGGDEEGAEHGGGAEGAGSGGGDEGSGFGGGGEGAQHGGGQEGAGHGGGPASGEGETMQPTQLQAPSADISAVAKSNAVQVTASEVSATEVSSYLESVESTFSSSTLSSEMTLSSPVTQWNSHWIGYDRYYRPVFTNPYKSPMQVTYNDGGAPRSFSVAPQQRAVLSAPTPGVYNFTAMTRPASGPPANISVGSFSGGGFRPGPGQAPPQKPAALPSTKNPLVQVKFTRGSSDPFRVSSLIDLGKDPTVNGATKVLLDGEIPAWGEWSKNSAGEAQFEITHTQLLPGLKPPGQEPLPGYQVRLTAASQSTSWFDHNRSLLVGVAAAAGVLALAAVALTMIRRRRTTGD